MRYHGRSFLCKILGCNVKEANVDFPRGIKVDNSPKEEVFLLMIKRNKSRKKKNIPSLIPLIPSYILLRNMQFLQINISEQACLANFFISWCKLSFIYPQIDWRSCQHHVEPRSSRRLLSCVWLITWGVYHVCFAYFSSKSDTFTLFSHLLFLLFGIIITRLNNNKINLSSVLAFRRSTRAGYAEINIGFE